MFDSCGMAGGHKPPQGGFGGICASITHQPTGAVRLPVALLVDTLCATVHVYSELPVLCCTSDVNTSHAKLGDAGSKTLPKTPTGVKWSAGMSYEVSWSIEANHAGGYLYRLAPADGPLTEEEFNKTPLEFVGKQGFRWGGGPAKGGSELFFNGTYVRSARAQLGFLSACPALFADDLFL